MFLLTSSNETSVIDLFFCTSARLPSLVIFSPRTNSRLKKSAISSEVLFVENSLARQASLSSNPPSTKIWKTSNSFCHNLFVLVDPSHWFLPHRSALALPMSVVTLLHKMQPHHGLGQQLKQLRQRQCCSHSSFT